MGIILERAVGPGVGVAMEPFVARLVTIGADDRVLIGKQKHQLGVSFAIGKCVVDRSGRFRVRIGPVDPETFQAMLPGGARHKDLRDIILQFMPPHVEAELEVLMTPGGTVGFQLGKEGASTLGSSTRLPQKDVKSALRARVLLTEPDAIPEITPAEDDIPEAATA
jgi:type VI secretion system protein ImpH